MSVNMILQFNVKPGQADAVVDYFAANLPETRVFEGCEDIKLFRVEGEPDRLMIIEQWQSQDCYDKYFAWRSESGAVGELLDLLASPLEVTRLEQAAA